MLNEVYDLKFVTAHVIEEKVWSETRVSGGGGGSTPFGGVHISSVKSSTVEKQRVWLQDDTGHQFEITFKNNEMPCRAGHSLTLIYMRAKRKADEDKNNYNVMVYNNTTGAFSRLQSGLNDVVNDAVKFSFLVLFAWLGGFYLIANIFTSPYNNFEAISTLLFFVSPLFVSYLRHRGPRKLADRILETELQRLKGLPLSKIEKNTALNPSMA